MKEIKYNNKTIKLPFPDADYSDQPFEMEEVKNPFSGESIALPRFAVAVYDVTMGSNHLAEMHDSKHGTGTAHNGTQFVKVWIGFVDTSQKNIWSY